MRTVRRFRGRQRSALKRAYDKLVSLQGDAVRHPQNPIVDANTMSTLVVPLTIYLGGQLRETITR